VCVTFNSTSVFSFNTDYSQYATSAARSFSHGESVGSMARFSANNKYLGLAMGSLSAAEPRILVIDYEATLSEGTPVIIFDRTFASQSDLQFYPSYVGFMGDIFLVAFSGDAGESTAPELGLYNIGTGLLELYHLVGSPQKVSVDANGDTFYVTMKHGHDNTFTGGGSVFKFHR